MRFFIDHAPSMMGVVALAEDGDLLHLYDNAAAARVFGLRAGKTEGRTARSLGASDKVIALWRSACDSAWSRGAPVTFEYLHDTPQGPRTLAVTVNCLSPGPEGERRFGYIGEDLSPGRQAEAALAEKDASLRGLFEQVSVGLALVGVDGRWLRVNPRLCDMLGYTAEEFADLTFAEMSYPGDLPDDLAQVQRLLDGAAASYTLEKRYVRKDGAILWGRLNVTLIRDAEGRPDHFISVVEDITARKAAEEELVAAERRLAMATHSANLGVWEWESGEQAVHYSARARAICGFEPEAPLSIADVLQRVSAPDRERIMGRVDRPRAPGDQHLSVEYRIDHPTLGQRWVRASSTTVVEPGADRRARLFGTLEDITEQRENEERLRILMREVDHRANNLLTVVQSVVALSQGLDVEDYRKVLAGRVSALARAHQLLADARWVGADLRRLVEEELKPYGLGQDRRIALEAAPSVSLTPSQAQALGLTLHELATNAAKHGALSRAEGQVRLGWRITDDTLELTWREIGGPAVKRPSRSGFGATVLGRALGGALGGGVDLTWAEEGLQARLHLPVGGQTS